MTAVDAGLAVCSRTVLSGRRIAARVTGTEQMARRGGEVASHESESPEVVGALTQRTLAGIRR